MVCGKYIIRECPHAPPYQGAFHVDAKPDIFFSTLVLPHAEAFIKEFSNVHVSNRQNAHI